MQLIDILKERSNNTCEICNDTNQLSIYFPFPAEQNEQNKAIYICQKCTLQIDKKEDLAAAHWQEHLPVAMWSEQAVIQAVAWRMLQRFKDAAWAQDNIDMLYLDDEWMEFAKASGDHESDATVDLHRDSFGVQLQHGDTVILNKTLDVKGSSLKATVGTVIKNIKLVPDNTAQIECKVEGQTIIILTQYVRKQSAL